MFLIPVLMVFVLSVNAYGKEQDGTPISDSISASVHGEDLADLKRPNDADTDFKSDEDLCTGEVPEVGTDSAKNDINEVKGTDTSEATVEEKEVSENVSLKSGENTSEIKTEPERKNVLVQKNDGKSNTKEIEEAKTNSRYTVEFKHNDLEYVLRGNESVKLSKILDKLKIEGKIVEKVECSNENLFSASKKSGL